MVAGRGFIALAIVILGRWNPWGALAAAAFFGLAQAMQVVLGAGGTGLPYQLFLALPYLATLVALLIRFGASRPPASLAVPYRRS
jgi:general nucleoside transport system permease protein